MKELTEHRSDDDNGQAFYRDTMQQCSAMMLCIVRCPKPVIARVHGIATAAGCQLVASCDLAVASSHARFATPGVNIGLFCSTPMVALSRNISRKHAMEMLLLGDMISAEKAAELGLAAGRVALPSGFGVAPKGRKWNVAPKARKWNKRRISRRLRGRMAGDAGPAAAREVVEWP